MDDSVSIVSFLQATAPKLATELTRERLEVIGQLCELREQHAKLAEFARWVLRYFWDQTSMDGCEAQDEAEKLGLIYCEPWDPDGKHENENFTVIDLEPGDSVQTFVDWLKPEEATP